MDVPFSCNSSVGNDTLCSADFVDPLPAAATGEDDGDEVRSGPEMHPGGAAVASGATSNKSTSSSGSSGSGNYPRRSQALYEAEKRLIHQFKRSSTNGEFNTDQAGKDTTGTSSSFIGPMQSNGNAIMSPKKPLRGILKGVNPSSELQNHAVRGSFSYPEMSGLTIPGVRHDSWVPSPDNEVVASQEFFGGRDVGSDISASSSDPDS